MGVSYSFFYKLKNMKIITNYYNFYKELGKYYIKNTGFVNPIIYNLYSVQNNLETLVGEVNNSIDPLDITEIELPTETIYKLVIYYQAVEVENTSYDIKHFPSLKNSIITTMKEVICGCSNLDNISLNCTNTSVSLITQDVFDTQMLLIFMGSYKDILLPPNFLNQYNYCFTQTLENNSSTLLSLLSNIYTQLDLNGNSPNSTRLIRLYTTYMYILFYTLELNYASYPDLPDTSISNEIDLVKSLFDLENLESCYNELNIDYIRVIETLQACLINDMPVIYSGTLSTDTWVDEATVLLGDSFLTNLNPTYIIFQPSTNDDQYKWFAIPENIATLLINWAEDESELNHDLIGTASSSQFIIRADTVISINSISYRLFKYNWASSFSTILKLS